jgi:hypothetical protein
MKWISQVRLFFFFLYQQFASHTSLLHPSVHGMLVSEKCQLATIAYEMESKTPLQDHI